MTDHMMKSRALVEKTSDVDRLREMIGFAANRLMESEVEGVTGAAFGEESQERRFSATATVTGAIGRSRLDSLLTSVECRFADAAAAVCV